MVRCTIGVLAYNEEQNIRQVLTALLSQRAVPCCIEEIIVIASGCTDRTVEFAAQVARDHPLIRIEIQARRAGKAAAINHLLQLARGDLIVLVGADTIPDPGALQALLQPLLDDSTIGMTGARVVPLNVPSTALGFAVQLLWHLHHEMAQRRPKLGELVAFRNIVGEIPCDCATDELMLEALITAKGYRLLYTPRAIVYNVGARTFPDFLDQRRRIYAGHLEIAARYGYRATSMEPGQLLALAGAAILHYPSRLPWICNTALMELAARFLGRCDRWFGRCHGIWRRIGSTKHLHAPGESATLVSVRFSSRPLPGVDLLHRATRIPSGLGSLLWWSHAYHEALFLLPGTALPPHLIRERLERFLSYLGIAPPSFPAHLDYRVTDLASGESYEAQLPLYPAGRSRLLHGWRASDG